MSKELMKKIILLITFAVVLFVSLQNLNIVLDITIFIISLFVPFILGIVIAFVLNVLLKFIENKLLKNMPEKNFKLKRAISLILTLIIVVGFIIFLLFLIIPELKNAITIFIDNIPIYQEQLLEFATKFNLSTETIDSIRVSLNSLWESILSLFKNNSSDFIEITLGVTTKVLSGITNFILGLVFAVYMLADKEKLIRQVKKLLDAFIPKKKIKKIIEIEKLSCDIFSKFIVGQVTEALIIGVLCFVGMLILGLPYASTISVLVGFTALIPVFGAFIGTAIGAILIFVVDPIGALIFIIYIIILQQIEGNLIYPKVVGSKVGLPGIWVMLAVLVGGSLGGIVGMLIGVPLCSIIYVLLTNYVNKKLIKKDKKVKESNN